MDAPHLCDVCRQNPAVQFYVDVPTGVVNRQVCGQCKLLSPDQQAELLANSENRSTESDSIRTCESL
jgi:hypothetical protein